MFAFSRFSVTHPVLVNLLTLLIVVTGTGAFLLLPRELFPYVSADFIFVRTVYPRSSADEMEKTITVLLEDEISEVRGIKRLSSVTIEGLSVIVVEVDTDNPGIVIDQVRRDIEAQVEEVVPDLPREAEKPVVTQLILDFPVMTVSLSGAVDELELKRTAEFVKDRLKGINGVSEIGMIGERDEEIWVEIDPSRLYGFGLTLEEARVAIELGGVDLAAGLARGSREEFIVRTQELYKSPEDIERVVLKTEGEGRRVRVADIAQVRDTFEEATTIGRLDGERCINLDVKQRPGADTLRIADEVRRVLAESKEAIPFGVSTKINRDLSFAVRERLDLLTKNGAYGLLLCLLILRFFLSGRMALITGLGIPFAFMGGLLVMYFTGVSLNMISMFSLIMVLGMLVDDGIVVAENTHRYLERGVDPLTAAIRGTGEVFWSVFAAVLTTVTAFAPMLFMSGIMGKFCRSIPLVVIFALLASLVEALLVLPVHLAEWSRPNNWKAIYRGGEDPPGWKPGRIKRLLSPLGAIWQHLGEMFDRSVISPNYWFDSLLKVYTRTLILVLRHRFAAMALLVAFTGSVFFYAARMMPFELFRNTDISFFFINVELPPGTRLEETERAVAEIERYLAEQPKNHIEAAVGRVGAIEDQMGQLSFGSNKGQVLVDLMEPEHHPGVAGQDILEEVRARFPSIPSIAKLEFKVDNGGPPTGAPVNVRISGEDYDQLAPISKEVQEYLHGVDGVFDIKDDFEWGKEEFRIQVDREKASDLGIDVARVAREVRNAFAGGLAASFTRGKEEVEIYVKFPEGSRSSLENIRLMKFRNDSGDLVPFENFAKVEYGQGLSAIGRWDQRRTITVSADVDSDIITSREINQKLQEKFGFQSERYPGVLFDYAGENEDTEEALTSLMRAFFVALFVDYVIIATVFNSFMQPLVVMSAIPLAGIGVVLGLLVHGEPMGFMALLGCVALVGIVVNDSIILLDFVNKARLRGLSRWRSLIWSAKVRVRPILLTSLTTIGGLIPMLTGLTGTSTFLVPMAVALVYGLVFSTVLLLLVVPLLMSMLDGARSYFGYRLVRPEYDENLLRKSMGLKPIEET